MPNKRMIWIDRKEVVMDNNKKTPLRALQQSFQWQSALALYKTGTRNKRRDIITLRILKAVTVEHPQQRTQWNLQSKCEARQHQKPSCFSTSASVHGSASISQQWNSRLNATLLWTNHPRCPSLLAKRRYVSIASTNALSTPHMPKKDPHVFCGSTIGPSHRCLFLLARH